MSKKAAGKVAQIDGQRDHCERPPAATPLERAVDKTWADARPLLSSLSYATRDPLRAAMQTSAGPERLAAARRAYMSDRIVNVLVTHLGPALEAEGLRCADCPAPIAPQLTTIEWAAFAPHLTAYA